MGFQKIKKKEKEIIILKQTETNENISISKRLHYSHMHLHHIDERIRIILWFNVVTKHKRTIEFVFIIVYILLKIFNIHLNEWKENNFRFGPKIKTLEKSSCCMQSWIENQIIMIYHGSSNNIPFWVKLHIRRMYELAVRLRRKGKGII